MTSRLLISLWQALSETKYQNIFVWDLPEGRSFSVKDMYHFNAMVLPFLDCPSFVDFSKKLNFLGFTVSGTTFSHEKFVRGRSDLLSQLLTDTLQLDEISNTKTPYQPAVPNDLSKRNKTINDPSFGSHRKFEVQQNVAELRQASRNLMDAVAKLQQGQNDNQKLLGQTLLALRQQRNQQQQLGEKINKIYPSVCPNSLSNKDSPDMGSKNSDSPNQKCCNELSRAQKLLAPPQFVPQYIPQACQLKQQTNAQQLIRLQADAELDMPSSCPETKYCGKRQSSEVRIIPNLNNTGNSANDPKKFANSFGGIDSKTKELARRLPHLSINSQTYATDNDSENESLIESSSYQGSLPPRGLSTTTLFKSRSSPVTISDSPVTLSSSPINRHDSFENSVISGKESNGPHQSSSPSLSIPSNVDRDDIFQFNH